MRTRLFRRASLPPLWQPRCASIPLFVFWDLRPDRDCRQIYFHLGSLGSCLDFALRAGALFDVMSKTEFVETIVSYGVDTYIRQQTSSDATSVPDARLEGVVNRMFERCFHDGQHKQALGIALEARRLDIVRASIASSGKPVAMLSYCLSVCMTVVQNKAFRNAVLDVVVQLHMEMKEKDYEAICRCLVYLNDAAGVANVIGQLICGSEVREQEGRGKKGKEREETGGNEKKRERKRGQSDYIHVWDNAWVMI